MIWILLLAPALAGAAAFMITAHAARRALVVATAAAHFAFVIRAWSNRDAQALGGWLALDAPGLLFLSTTSLLFLAASVYAVGYLAREGRGERADIEEGFLFSNVREATFSGCLLLFLASMTFVTLARHVGFLWVAVEMTTLVSAPLIIFHRHKRSLEAMWKYLLVCSMGIALALLGNFFLTVAAGGEGRISMTFPDLQAQAAAGSMNVTWLKAAFLLFLVGYGTKMGLAPLHTWLPDAHSEAPSVVSALLSGALLNCAFLAILRINGLCVSAGLGVFSRQLLLVFGIISMFVAAGFMIAQTDFKRMLAYSSVEHMGILAVGAGIGGLGASPALFHAANHSLAKALLFMTAGNIMAAYRSKRVDDVRGVLSVLKFSGPLWMAGLLAISGFPPFGTFVSEFAILRAALTARGAAVAAAYAILLAVAFVAMSAAFLRMAYGRPGEENGGAARAESVTGVLPPAILAAAVLMNGIYAPPALTALINEAATILGR